MRNRFVFAGLFVLGTLVGCDTRDHRELAQKNLDSARQNVREGDYKQARKDYEDAAHHQREARKDDGEIQPVAGADTMKQLRDKLGKDWVVSEQGKKLTAVRKEPKMAKDDFRKDVNDKVASLRKDHAGANARVEGNTVMLSGKFQDCGDALDSADGFSHIDGVNKIVLDATCL